ncbi:hypothetical protein [Nonomuraea zeae]|uniref:Uncharacterized protein n=1 Tax=Nonomuraea zeae TaxID=1642303 RepID=A0A5S4G500_9ACTN|nr:hypothetical protein [Nonomuraea zeae]TMR27594.1 hypothetical protein ETD85_38690 [Nonomuraea zeae]
MGSSKPPVELLIGGAFVLVALACATAALTMSATAGVAVLAVTAATFSAWSRRLVVGPAIGVMAWCFATGFLLNGMGELTLTWPDDEARLLGFLAVGTVGSACGTVGSACGTARRRLRRRARRRGPALMERRCPGEFRKTGEWLPDREPHSGPDNSQ